MIQNTLLARRIFSFILLIAVLALGFSMASVVEAANIDPTNSYAQFLDATNGRINFDPTGQGMTVSSSGTDGFIWGESVGWINTNPTNGNVGLSCSGGTGTFSGYWWGENTGWINLAPTNGGVTIDANGKFDGYAWSENYGWIEFTCPGADTCVQTTYTCSTSTPPSSNPPSSSPPNPDNYDCELIADETTITAGSPVELSWDTSIPDGYYTDAEIDPVGEIDGNDSSLVVYPNQTTTYTGTFDGGFVNNTTLSCSTTVTVTEAIIQGCTDVTALNYDSNATEDDGSCQYENPILGCTDIAALNYNPNANTENGSCTYPVVSGCTDVTALNYDSNATEDDGSCQYEEIEPETDPDPGPGPGGDSDSDPDPDLDDASDEDPTAYIVDGTLRVPDDEDMANIIVRRDGSTDEPYEATLQILDGTAQKDTDYEGMNEYYLSWAAGDDTDRIISIGIIRSDDDEDDSQRYFTARLIDAEGNFLDDAKVIIGNSIIPTIVSLVLLLTGFSSLPFRIQNILLAIPSYRRRHRGWGVVFDSKTKEPLDPAYVQLFDLQGNEVASSITDLDGRFAFLVEPGRYRLSTGKTNYEFPSQHLKGQEHTAMYQNLYFGEEVEVTEKGEVIRKNIPMDSSDNENWNEEAKRKMKVNQFFNRHDGIAHRIIDLLFVVGFAVSIYAAVINPVWYNLAVVALYVVMTIVSLLGVTSRSYGQIKSNDGQPVKGAVVRAFNAHLDKEVAHRVVSESGYYYMLVQKGEYYITVELPGEGDEYRHVYTSENFKARNGVIRKTVELDI